nr:hypothetical protein GCM10020241_46220 [Streptoalloteichus tenebrarius]
MDCDVDTDQRKRLVTHAYAPLTPMVRLRLARCVVDEGWPLRRAAERFQVWSQHGETMGRPLPERALPRVVRVPVRDHR